jgi:arsenite methyltransferase
MRTTAPAASRRDGAVADTTGGGNGGAIGTATRQQSQLLSARVGERSAEFVRMPERERDQWAQWLLHRRHGGDPEQLQQMLAYLRPIRDRVLDHAGLAAGETLLDVGCGDGLIAFAALERVGDQGTVIFSDISQDLLDHCQSLAAEMGVLDRCRFVRAGAEDLAEIPDGSVDVITSRSVLIYVADKPRAFAEFFRVLRPGGRISLFEPINRFGMGQPSWDAGPIQELRDQVRAVYEALQPRDTDPMLDFDERDLLSLAEAAGFREIHLVYQADIEPAEPRPWETTLHSSGNPRIPTLAEAMAQVLTPEEAARYEAYLRPIIERGEGVSRGATADLWAVKA